jgi:hypothetical protein
MTKRRNKDDERHFGTFSQINIYVVDTKILKRFLGSKSLNDHYNDWLNGNIYSNQYILNALKSNLQSIDFDNAYYIVKSYGNKKQFRFKQNEFYEFDKSDIAFLKLESEKMLEAKPNFYIYKKHIDKLDKLQSRLENGKLDSKTLLISTW